MIDRNSQFMAILTNVGAAKLANANALGIPWNLTALGVGDANGTDPMPSATQTKLINEQRRAPLNQLRVDPVNAAVIIAEQVIPADIGGWWIREIGLYDSDGDLVAVSNCAPSFKPALDQGSGRTQIVRMNFVVSSINNIVLKIDPAIVLATREYVDMAITEAINKQDFKHSVLVATTANIVLSGIQTVDGVLLATDARVLVKDQAQAKDNGIYVVPASGAWKRAQDADTSVEVTPGLFVAVEKGTANGDSVWQLVTDAPIVLGTTALTFEVVVGRTGVVAGTYRSLTVDRLGRVIAGTNPTTLAGSGITDGATKAELANGLASKQDALGFAPVQQGTGVGQSSNRVKIGWSNNSSPQLKVTVDESDQGYFWLSSNFDPAKKADVATTPTKTELSDGLATKPHADDVSYVGFASGDPRQPYFRKRTNDAVYLLQPALGYTPVQQGTGIGQSANPIKIGHSPSGPKITVDNTDFGVIWCQNNFSPDGKADKSNTYTISQVDSAISVRPYRDSVTVIGLASNDPNQPYMRRESDNSLVMLAPNSKFQWGLSASLTTNGYIVFPTWLYGFTIQWGLASPSASVMSFPIAFANSCAYLGATANADANSSGGNTEYMTMGWVLSNSQFKIRTGTSNVVAVRWLAVGY